MNGTCGSGQRCVSGSCKCDGTSCGGCCRRLDVRARQHQRLLRQGGVACAVCAMGTPCGTGDCGTCGGNGQVCCAGSACAGALHPAAEPAQAASAAARPAARARHAAPATNAGAPAPRAHVRADNRAPVAHALATQCRAPPDAAQRASASRGPRPARAAAAAKRASRAPQPLRAAGECAPPKAWCSLEAPTSTARS